ncbi:hypothetical protein RKLH11_4050 [Rhodobacteraceae bacterium KLH11]|nr:hypothetical protein RKLH11_4050 [Rhodobacteraceae bacterium KLH11]
MLGWLVDRKIAPHIPVIDKAAALMAYGPALTLKRMVEMSGTWFAARNQFAIMFGERFDA